MNATASPLGIGIIGAGWFGERHAAAIRQVPGLRLVGACRDGGAGIDDFVAVHGGRPYPDAGTLLADPSIDAVVIATPHGTHAPLAVAAARAGKAILLEKPMAPTLAECDTIAAAVQKAGVALMVGHTQRFAPPLVAAKALLESGSFGRVRFGHSAMVKLWMEPNRRPWHLRSEGGGGMLMTAGIHALDRLLWLVDAPVTRVTAVAGAVFHEQEADDSALLLLRFEGGAAATVHSIAYRDGAPYGGTELVCDDGVILIDPAGSLRTGRGGAWAEVPLPPSSDMMGEMLIAEWRAFLALVRDGGPNPADAASARATIACITAALDSARTGREVAVSR